MENDIPEDLLNFLTETPMDMPTTTSKPEREQPYVKIVEEPAKDLYKFRYESEGDTAGAIPGENQQRGGKSFPKIILCNHTGPAILQVCAVTDDLHVHPNKLVRYHIKKLQKYFSFKQLLGLKKCKTQSRMHRLYKGWTL